MIKLIQTMCHLLEEGEDVVLATLVGNTGSTPRTIGAKMLVRRNGEIAGTIGGGLVEAQVLQYAPGVFRTRNAELRVVDLLGASTETTDQMICGGRMEFLLEFIAATKQNAHRWKTVTETIGRRPNYILLSKLEAGGGQGGEVERWLVHGEKGCPETFPYSENWLDLMREQSRKGMPAQVVEIDTQRFLVETSLYSGTVYVLGAGHVGQQVATVTALVHFETVVLDDRAEFANVARFPQADKIKVLASFEHALDDFELGDDSYVVIVTRGHIHDKTTLEQALRTPAGYIGMIGSKRKRDMIYQTLLQEGFSQDDINRVHSPIGLPIGAETPEEIAVSIVAELIRERSERSKK